MILIELFFTFVKIGAFSFGGGYAMLPLIEDQIVNIQGWLTIEEFINIVAISQMTPGPIATNSSTFVGYKVAGLPGAIFATLGVTITSFILVSLISKKYSAVKDAPEVKNVFMGLRPAVIGLIISAAISIASSSIVDIRGFLIATMSFLLIAKAKIHPIAVICIGGLVGLLVT